MMGHVFCETLSNLLQVTESQASPAAAVLTSLIQEVLKEEYDIYDAPRTKVIIDKTSAKDSTSAPVPLPNRQTDGKSMAHDLPPYQ